MQSLPIRFWLAFSFACISAALASPTAKPAPQMIYLDNGTIRIGMDLALGGAVTYLSSKEHPGNLINSADLGRQIQMSHYSGPWPFEADGKKPSPNWAGLGWNPIQTGDCYLNPSRVVSHRNDGKEIYIQCVPMQWPLENVPGDCLFETWTTLESNVVHMRFRCTNQRKDTAFYRPCSQELPAVYTISRLSRLMAYTGEHPFANEPATRIENDWRKPWPWTRFIATEGWAALVNEQNWGLGVFKADGLEFHGGIYGDERTDDPQAGATAYVAPIHVENFDHNIVYEHRTELVAGSLDEIRKQCLAMASRQLPAWKFQTTREHWTVHEAADQGFPLKGEWRVRSTGKRLRLQSPLQCWRAEAAPKLKIELACQAPTNSVSPPATELALRIYWKQLKDEKIAPQKSVLLKVPTDGRFRSEQVNLAAAPDYQGLITGLVIEPLDTLNAGMEIAIKSIQLSPAAR